MFPPSPQRYCARLLMSSNRAGSQKAFLEFNEYDSSGHKLGSKPFSPDEIAKRLHRHGIDCAVLSSCKTAVADSGVEANLSWSFLNQGVASVVAMSYNIPDSMSEIFFRRFYQEILVGGREMADAVAIARKELRQNRGRWSYEHQTRIDVQDWFVPKYYSDGSRFYIDGNRKLFPDFRVWVPSTWSYMLIATTTLLLGISILDLLAGPLIPAAGILSDVVRAAHYVSKAFIPLFLVLLRQIYQTWTKWGNLEILKSINHDRKNILRLEGDLQRCHKVFLHARDDVEGTAPSLVTILSDIWRRTHLVQHRIIIQADWFIHPLDDVDIHDWRVLLSSFVHLLWLWMLEFSPGLQCMSKSNCSDEECSETRTVVVIDNINALFPEDLHRKAYHEIAQRRFYDWIERYFGSTESEANKDQPPNYLVLIGNTIQDNVQEWFKGTLGTCSVLESAVLTKYINPKDFPHRTEDIATGRSWL